MKARIRRIISWQLERRVKRLIREQKLKVVAVTGSVGKTSTKLAIATVLKQKYRVLAHPGNYNSEIGLPLSIFELDVPETLTNPISWIKILRQIDKKLEADYPYDILVLELGADEPGDVKKFMRYISPDIGIVTAIAPVHTEQFGSIEAIAEEKMALARGSDAVLLNAEDKTVMTEAKKLGKPVQTYGVSTGNVHFEGVKRTSSLTLSGRLQLHNGELAVETRLVGEHGLSSLAAAGSVAEDLGLEPHEVKAGIEAFAPVSGRMRVLRGAYDSVIIDDTYNSSPRSAVAALGTLMDMPGRKIAVLGSMNELGSYAEDGHREVGKAAKGVDLLITIGELAGKFTIAGAAEAGLKTSATHTFKSPYEAGKFLGSELKKGDVVLAKGSQNGVFAEEAIAEILADPTDRSQLVRQSQAWIKRKHEQFGV